MNEKTKKILIGLCITIVILLLCALCYFASSAVSSSKGNSSSTDDTTETSDDSDSEADQLVARAQEESDNVSEDEQKDFEEIDIDQYLDLYNGNENVAVLFSRPTCGYCQIAEPILHHISYLYDFPIYNVNIDEMDSDDNSKLLESDDFFSNGYGTPLLIAVSDGEIVDMINGLVDTATYVDFFTDNGFIKEQGENYEKCL